MDRHGGRQVAMWPPTKKKVKADSSQLGTRGYSRGGFFRAGSAAVEKAFDEARLFTGFTTWVRHLPARWVAALAALAALVGRVRGSTVRHSLAVRGARAWWWLACSPAWCVGSENRGGDSYRSLGLIARVRGYTYFHYHDR